MADSDSTFRMQPRADQPPAEREAEPPVTPGEPPPWTLAGEYVLHRLLASGGHGSVYEAEHRILGRRAAVKVLHHHLAAQGEMLQRFVREARVVNQIRHPHIVDVFDFGMLPDGSPYYVMELLEGRTLSQLLQERGRMSVERALTYLEPVCAALEAAHKAGVIHRDLKASNVLVVAEGEPPVVKLLDFGIAKLVHPEPGQEGLTIAGQRLGTAHAMAPEQFHGGTIGTYTDIYALGVLLFQLLTGRYPFLAEDRMEVERLHLEAPAPRPSSFAPVAPAVDAVVLRALEKEGARRYPTVGAFLGALREAAAPPEALPSSGRIAPGVGLYAEVELEDATHDDEAAYATLADILDGLEKDLRAAGFVLAMQTGMALLGVRLLEGTPTPEATQPLLESVRALYRRARVLAAGARVRVHACLHVGPVEVRLEADTLEVLGGPLTEVAEWVARDAQGLRLTDAAAHALHA
jgi:serine/threonine-protein kinase